MARQLHAPAGLPPAPSRPGHDVIVPAADRWNRALAFRKREIAVEMFTAPRGSEATLLWTLLSASDYGMGTTTPAVAGELNFRNSVFLTAGSLVYLMRWLHYSGEIRYYFHEDSPAVARPTLDTDLSIMVEEMYHGMNVAAKEEDSSKSSGFRQTCVTSLGKWLRQLNVTVATTLHLNAKEFVATVDKVLGELRQLCIQLTADA